MIVLVPLYFTYSGLRTNLADLNTWQLGVGVIIIICISMLGKIGGATIAARILRNPWRFVQICALPNRGRGMRSGTHCRPIPGNR